MPKLRNFDREMLRDTAVARATEDLKKQCKAVEAELVAELRKLFVPTQVEAQQIEDPAYFDECHAIMYVDGALQQQLALGVTLQQQFGGNGFRIDGPVWVDAAGKCICLHSRVTHVLRVLRPVAGTQTALTRGAPTGRALHLRNRLADTQPKTGQSVLVVRNGLPYGEAVFYAADGSFCREHGWVFAAYPHRGLQPAQEGDEWEVLHGR